MGFCIRVAPVVVFVAPDWFRADECSCPVFSDTNALYDYFTSLGGSGEASEETCREVAQTISASFELFPTAKIKPGNEAAPAWR